MSRYPEVYERALDVEVTRKLQVSSSGVRNDQAVGSPFPRALPRFCLSTCEHAGSHRRMCDESTMQGEGRPGTLLTRGVQARHNLWQHKRYVAVVLDVLGRLDVVVFHSYARLCARVGLSCIIIHFGKRAFTDGKRVLRFCLPPRSQQSSEGWVLYTRTHARVHNVPTNSRVAKLWNAGDFPLLD
jgi:hypothetical protein